MQPRLTAPNKTLSFSKARRQTSNSVSPISPEIRSPSFDLSDPLSTRFAQQTTLTSTVSNPAVAIKPSLSSTPSSLLRKQSDPSNLFTAAQTAALRTLCSNIALDLHDSSFWSSLLLQHKYPVTHTPQDAYDVEMATVGLAIDLAANNLRTCNFNKLCLYLLSLLRELKSHPQTIPVQTYNALFLFRVFSNHFAGNLTNDEMMDQFEGTVNHVHNQAPFIPDNDKLAIDPEVQEDTRPIREQILDALLTIIVNSDPHTNYSIYEFYTEVLNTLLALLSTQLHHTRVTEKNYFMDVLMERFSNRTDAIVAKLLENATEQKSPPAQSSSMVYSAYNYLFASRTGSAGDADSLPVADRSLLLLLLLATQRSSNGEWAGYRHALKGLRDHHVLSSDLENMDQKIHLISYKEMFELFCRSLANEERMLLFYLMLIENESFRVYVLSRTDPEIIYIPMLKLIYESIEGKTNYSQLYVLLTCLLIFSQDDVNNETIQKIMSNNLAWFTERPLLKSISLGGLVTLVLIRTLQLNLSHQKDIYFHTNCLAILANMSSAMLDMHAYVAQRIISLFELIARRYQKFTAKMQETGEEDVSVFEDLLALMLEIINCVLSHRLKNNIQLVYVLLLKRDIFAPFRLHTRFSDLIYNIEQVINYFNGRVSDANLKAPSTSEVLRVIEQAARTWSPNQLKSLPDLKFQYEEEMDAREFFLPYIWALIHRRTFIYWSEEKAHILQEYRLLNMDTADDGDPHHEK